MIRHCVFIRFRPDVTASERQALMADIAALQHRLPGILAVHVGANVSPETGMDKGYSDGFIVDFDGPAARDAYLEDPGHREVGGRLVAASLGGVEGIFVYDIEV